MRVLLFVLALVAMPLAAGAAQGSSGGNANENAANRCNNSPQAGKNAASQGGAAQAAEAQLHKNCAPTGGTGGGAGDPPPSSDPPPTGPHWVNGLVYEDVSGDGMFDMFAGEMGLAGWTVNLHWNGQVIASAVSDANGQFRFDALANATAYNVCVVDQGGYIRTQPGAGTACGGAGYAFSLNSSIATEYQPRFGMMLQQ